MNVIDLTSREGVESELALLGAELSERCLQGAPAAHHIAKLARRITMLADELGQSTARLRAT